MLLLDANNGPKNVPGETLHPGVEPILDSLGVIGDVIDAGFWRHCGIWHECDRDRVFVPYGADDGGQWFGFQADRRTLHEILQNGALAAGAVLERGVRPTRILYFNGRVEGVTLNGKEIRGRWTLDGTGRKAWLARTLGLGLTAFSPPLGVTFGWADGWGGQADGQPRFAFREDGWEWQAPLGGHRTAWVKLRIGDRPRQAPRGCDQTWYLRWKCAEPGYFLLGDSAAALDPSSSHGVLRALMSGILAGHLMVRCHELTVAEEFCIFAYEDWVRQQFLQDVHSLRRQYAGYPFAYGFRDPPWPEEYNIRPSR